VLYISDWLWRRILYCCLLLVYASLAGAVSPRAVSWTDGAVWLAALDGGQMRIARVTATAIVNQAAASAEGITTLAAGTWNGHNVLLGCRGKVLLRFDQKTSAWAPLGSVSGTIREILPARNGQSAAVIRTGGAGMAPKDGAVWWATWAKGFTCVRVAAVQAAYRPWQVWWSAKDGEERLAVATYKSTKFAPFEHNCMFLFTWKNGAAAPCWLGSRLTRPYVEAAHADLRGDGQWRLAAVETTQNDGRGLSVYAPIQFGYANEWKTDAIPGLQRIVAYGEFILCFGHNTAGDPLAWQLLPDGDKYRLVLLPEAPPAPETLTRIDDHRLGGWWDNAWHIIELTPEYRQTRT